MNYSIVIVVLLYSHKVVSISYPMLYNRYFTILTQEELVRRKVQKLATINTLTVDPRLPFTQVPRLAIPKLPELKILPEVKSLTVPKILPEVKKVANFKKPELPMLKTLPAILTVGAKKEENLTPPRIGNASSSLQDLLKAAMSNKQTQVKSTEYNSDEVWKNIRALQDRASQYILK